MTTKQLDELNVLARLVWIREGLELGEIAEPLAAIADLEEDVATAEAELRRAT